MEKKRHSTGYSSLPTVFILTVVVSCAAGPSDGASDESADKPEFQCQNIERLRSRGVVESLDAESWIGAPTEDIQRKLQSWGRQYKKTIRTGSPSTIRAEIKQLSEILGRYASVPERRPSYGVPIDDSPPDMDLALGLWRKSFENYRSLAPWRASTMEPTRNSVPRQRLRVSLRLARSYLHSYEAGLVGTEEYRADALAAFDYMLEQQASNGVFGFPHMPFARSGVGREAAKLVERARRSGVDPVENGWIIQDPSDSGGLKFDNGMVGVGLLQAYVLLKDERFLNAAIAAAEWAQADPLSLNFNYNGFSAYLFARLYRITGSEKYLQFARDTIYRGVLPGLNSSGRWIDPHNARVAYHSVMLRDMLEFYLALQLAGANKEACELQRQLFLALDNLALQSSNYGALEAHELLAVEPLVLATQIFGEDPLWVRAINVNINFLIQHFHEELDSHNLPLTQALAVYIRKEKMRESGELSFEFSNQQLQR